MTTRTLVLGTGNKKKGEELSQLLAPHGFLLCTLADFPNAIDVVEDGDSFAANAELKAVQQARHLGRWVLGEDSGICVDALDGRPGIYSARYSGENATDDANNRLLLEELREVAAPLRTAHYVCHACLSDPCGEVVARSESFCRGTILFSPRGSGGFGYDPLFEIAEYHRTFGELGSSVKALLSHRARALRQLIPQIVQLAGSGRWPADA